MAVGRAQNEVVEERMMRELSREVTVLMGVMAGLQRWSHISGSLTPKQVQRLLVSRAAPACTRAPPCTPSSPGCMLVCLWC